MTCTYRRPPGGGRDMHDTSASGSVARRRFAALLSLSMVVLVIGAYGAPAHASTSTTFSGRAAAVQGSVLGTPVSLSDTGPLPGSGGALEASLLSASVPGVLSADVLHAST